MSVSAAGLKGGRLWCGVIQYPGKKEIMYGTIFMSIDQTDAAIREALIASILEHLPAGFDLLHAVPGAIHFVKEEDFDV
jgi:hypothetical protein